MIRIFTDISSDYPAELIEKNHVEVLQQEVIFGDEVFKPGINMTNKEFYEKLETAFELPTTTQVLPHVIEQAFRSVVENGDQAICLFISSTMSGAFQTAKVLKEELKIESIYLVDSQQATMGLAVLVETAVRLRNSGMDASEIAKKLEEIAPKVRVWAIADTLKYLKKGGRLSPAAAVVGELLGIKPIIQVKQGIVDSIGKAKGQKKVFQMILEKFQEEKIDLDYPVAFGHSNAPHMAEEMYQMIGKPLGVKEYINCEIGSIVGTHAGPNCAGMGFVVK